MEKRKEIVRNKKTEIARLTRIMESFCEENDIPLQPRFEINLVLEEILMNIISYGYDDDHRHEIEVTWWLDNDEFNMIISDDGRKFDPLLLPEPELTKTVEERTIGGLGIHLVKKMMCEITYVRENDKNILRMKKRIKSMED